MKVLANPFKEMEIGLVYHFKIRDEQNSTELKYEMCSLVRDRTINHIEMYDIRQLLSPTNDTIREWDYAISDTSSTRELYTITLMPPEDYPELYL